MTNETFLFLPGILCDDELFAYPLERLRWDALHADLTQDDTIGGMAQRALETTPERVALVGLGMGGIVALEMIRQAPQRVISAIVFNTPYQPMTAEQQAVYHTYTEMTQNGRVDDVIAAMIDSGMVSELRARIDPHLIEQTRRMAQRVGAAAFEHQAQAMLTRGDYTPVLESCPCFVQVMAGDMDKWVDWATAEEMVALLPHGKFGMLNNCGHLSPWEQPFDTIAALNKWQQRFALENLTEEDNAQEPD